MTEPYRHSVSVAGVTVREDGHVLVIRRRDNGQWQAPGGILEAGEQIPEGLTREVLEETGVRVAPEQLTGVYKHMTLGVVALVFRCRTLDGEPRATLESAEAAWVAPEVALAQMTEAFAVRVRDALGGPWPHVRAHDGVHLLPGSVEA